ncbi:thiamine phosphate synthase [Benzoatithermus flavus]|uniref:Thiamine-phosphate synthase n=1 Tax=Benzoatithermus flavus TaxID=3108223 RepID=A0ABU8XND1_9PROT
MRRRFALDLYLVTDRAMCARLGIERVVADAVAGGVTLVQLRDDVTPAAELVAIGRRLKALLAPADVPLIVNNRLDVALACGADGIHVGQSDAPPAEARARLGERAILGLSITDPVQLGSVDPALVDYLGVGPIFATATKEDAAPAMGLAGLAAARAATTLPIVAIGGIAEGNAAEVVRAGADGIAVVSAICAADEPRAAAERLARTVVEARRGR